MNRAFLLSLFGASVIFLSLFFLRGDLPFYDSYHYACLACGCSVPGNEAPLAGLLFGVLPCSMLLFKGLMFACLVACLFFLEKTMKNASVYAFLFPAFVLEFTRFENDVFSFPFIFAAVYFFYASYKSEYLSRKYWGQQTASAVMILAACGFWGGALFTPFVLSLKERAWGMRCFALALGVLYGDGMLRWILLSINQGAEGIIGLSTWWLLPGLVLAILGIKKIREPVLGALLLSMVKGKLVVLSLVLLPVGVAQFAEQHPKIVPGLFIGVFFIILAIPSIVVQQEPKQEWHSAIEYALERSENNRIQNDWDIGYIVKWHGGITTSYGGRPRQPNIVPGIMVSRHDLNCVLDRNFGLYSVWTC